MSETQASTEVQASEVNDLDTFSSEFFGQKAEPEETSQSEVEQEPSDETEEEVTEAQEADTEESDDEAKVEETEKPKKKTVQDRIDELVKQRHDAERAAEERINKLQKEFEEKIAALQPKAPEKKTDEPSPADLNADGTDKYPLGEFDPLYIKDLTRFTLEQERTQAKIRDEQERQEREVKAQEQALMSAWNEKLEPAKTKYPDLEEKGQALINGFAGLEQGYAQYLTNLLMSMDQGPDVLYYLASNPDEAVKIVNSGAQRATLALGRIEAKFIEAEQQKQAAKPKVSKAPPPPAVTARGTGGGHATVEADTDDLDAFTKEFFKKRR